MADKPPKPIQPVKVMTKQLAGLFAEFLENERASGIILIVCTALSIGFANSFLGEQYRHFWHLELFNSSLQHWINDGLMSAFFLIGLEIGGIGFTMSIFITLLAFNNPEIIETSKLSILITSALAGTIGYLFLKERKGPEHAAR